MSDRIDGALRPLVDQLRARYPNVNIVDAKKTVWVDGLMQQLVTFRGTLSQLQLCGLVTDSMLRSRNERAWSGATSLGDGFHLRNCSHGLAGQWELDLCTESAPRETGRMSLEQASRVLHHILKRCSEL
jgi:hypothetical protein